MKKLFLSLFALTALLSVFFIGTSAASAATAKITLGSKSVTVKQFEQVNIDVDYGLPESSSARKAPKLTFVYSNGNAEAVHFARCSVSHYVYATDPEINKIGVLGLKPGKTKITVYHNISSKKKVKVGVINLTVKKNASFSSASIQKQLKKSITVKKGCDTQVSFLKKTMSLPNWRLICTHSTTLARVNWGKAYAGKLGQATITGKKTGSTAAKVYALGSFVLKTNKQTIRQPATKKLYLGKTTIKTASSKPSTLLKKKTSLKYQTLTCRNAFSLNNSNLRWREVSAAMNQKVYLRDLLNTYDPKSTYSATSSNSNIIGWGKNKTGVFLWARKAGTAKITIYQKEPKKKTVKVGTITVTSSGKITLADITRQYYKEKEKDADGEWNIYGINGYTKRIVVLEDNTGFAPPYDTYRVTFENKAPEYIKIDYDGTLTWLGLPPWNYATKEPIPFVDAHLTFVDGSEAVIPFVYDINEYT